MTRALALLLAFTVAGCARGPTDSPAPTPAEAPSAAPAASPEGAAWLLSGTNDERFARVAKHLRGFDTAMVETGYRYGELYWAGQDDNWDFARYQLEKLRTAVGNGVERRPKRARSALALDVALVSLEEAIVLRDAVAFRGRFDALTSACNTCHEQERAPFVHVRPPSVRTSPAGPLPARGGSPVTLDALRLDLHADALAARRALGGARKLGLCSFV